MYAIYDILGTIYCILYTIYCVLYAIYYILDTVYYILYNVYYILYTVYCILYTIYCILYTVYYILYTVYYALYTAYVILAHLVHKHTHTYTHTRQESSERVISPLLWPLPIQRRKQKAIHALSGIRTYDQSKRAPTALRLNLHGQRVWVFVISDFRRAVYENCVLLGHYAASSGNLLPTRLHNLAVLSLELKIQKESLQPTNQPKI